MHTRVHTHTRALTHTRAHTPTCTHTLRTCTHMRTRTHTRTRARTSAHVDVRCERACSCRCAHRAVKAHVRTGALSAGLGYRRRGGLVRRCVCPRGTAGHCAKGHSRPCCMWGGELGRPPPATGLNPCRDAGRPLPAVASLGDGRGLRAPAGSLQPPGHADGRWLFVRIRGLDGCRPPTRGSELDTALDAAARPAVAQGAETLLPLQAS